jgi:hypothetical protein
MHEMDISRGKTMEALNSNKFFLGVMLILINIGSRHLVDEFSADPAEYSRNLVLRRLAVFAVCFVGTHDLVVSILLTAGFIIIATGVSLRSREGMKNKKVDAVDSKADQPPYDAQAPLLFTGTA